MCVCMLKYVNMVQQRPKQTKHLTCRESSPVQAKAHQMPFYSITIESFWNEYEQERHRQQKTNKKKRTRKKNKETNTLT